jgi:hypothetical protein
MELERRPVDSTFAVDSAADFKGLLERTAKV